MKEIWIAIKNYFKKSDIFLLAWTVLTAGYGLVMIKSATLTYNTNQYIFIQFMGIVLGVGGYIVISLVDFDNYSSLWKWLYIVNILLLGSLQIFGLSEGGNRSWLRFRIAGIPLGVQPAEVAKVFFIITFSRHMYELRDKLNHIFSILQLGIHVMIPVGLIMVISADAGMALSLIVIFLFMIFAAGVYLRYFAVFFGAIGVSLPIIWNYVLKDTHRQRFMVVFNPELDKLGVGFQAMQSKLALGGGKLFGQGLFHGTQAQHPTRLFGKHTDFIFSVIGEELGFIGATVVILALCGIIVRALYVASQANTSLSRSMCFGIAGMFLFQMFANIGMCIGIMPVIGITLPLFSYGGTSVATMITALGIVSGVRYRRWSQDLRERNFS